MAAIGASLVLSVLGSAPVAFAGPADNGAAVARVEQAVRHGMNASGAPTAAFVVVDRAGSSSARGLGRGRDGRPVTGQTPFVIGSTSKSFTALAVMQLVDAGRVDLDAPVRRYVPELRLADGEAADAITVRHVLQQTSGLASTAGGPVLASANDGTALDAVRELRDVRLAGAPGTGWRYSNANYVLAGLVVERASGLPYPDYVQRRIFAPLGMTRSFKAIGPARDAGLAPGHRFWFGLPVASGPAVRPGLLAAGYLISTAGDLGRYLRMYLEGGLAADGTRIVSREGLDTMLAPGPQAHLGPWADGRASRYAMGWFVGGPWREPALLHPGNSPDSSAMITVLPERGLAVATLVGAGHELPVPGNPAVTDRMSRAAVQAAVAEPAAAGPSMRRFYVVFDLVVLALGAATASGLARAAWALRAERRPRHVVRGVTGVLARLGLGAFLLALPSVTGYGWSGVWTWAPDLGLVLLMLVALVVATAALRLAGLVRARHTTAVSSARVLETAGPASRSEG